jgi:hypothetical protein
MLFKLLRKNELEGTVYFEFLPGKYQVPGRNVSKT